VIPFGAISERRDPPLNHNFVVSLLDTSSVLSTMLDLAGLTVAGGFSECTGLEMAMQPDEYKEGGHNSAVLRFPNRVTWSNITLKKGAGLGTALWDWHYGFVIGAGSRRDGVITLLDAARAPVSVWHFRRGLPVKYSAPQLNATQNTAAIETIEIAHEGILMVPGFGAGGVLGAIAGVLG
jgi:phage tail-like protein